MNKKIIYVIIWMIVIFLLSNSNGASSSNQSNIIVNFIANIFKIENFSILSFIIRKLAHFTEYFILGVLVLNCYNFDNKKIILSIVICMMYAISDEVHQLFVDGRSGQVIDAMIDLFGSIVGIVVSNYTIKKYKK